MKSIWLFPGSKLLHRIFIEVFKTNHLFVILLLCAVTFEPLKMGEYVKKMAVLPKLLNTFLKPVDLKLKVRTLMAR